MNHNAVSEIVLVVCKSERDESSVMVSCVRGGSVYDSANGIEYDRRVMASCVCGGSVYDSGSGIVYDRPVMASCVCGDSVYDSGIVYDSGMCMIGQLLVTPPYQCSVSEL